MSLVTLADYKTALKVEDDTEDAKLSQYSLEIDQRIKSYLGYDIEETVYTDEIYNGDGSHFLFPRNIPVTTLTKLEVYDGEKWVEWTTADYTRFMIVQGGMFLYIEGNIFPDGIQNIRLAYTAGYDEETLPQDIYGVCKELMILKYRGIDKKALGVPSVSLGVGSNATVTNEMNEDDILKKIEHYELVRV